MTDMPGSRLWPLALMGWLATMPAPGEAQERNATTPRAVEAAGDGPGARSAWLGAARARYTAMPAKARDRLRCARRAERDGSAGGGGA